MQTFSRGPLTFDVRDAGPDDGEPVVLLHGFPQDGSAFDALAPALHPAGLRTLAPDQRGYSPGARPPGRGAYRVRELVEDVLALLRSAGLESAHVVGHDWGGVVGWALAAWHPWRVRSLTALSTPHPAAMSAVLGRSDQAARSVYVGAFQLPVAPEALLLARDAALLRRSVRGSGLPAPDADRYLARLSAPGALTAALNWYRALPLGPGRPIGRVAVPTLHVWGADDAYLGRAATEATGRFVTGAYQLEELPATGHWLPELAPDHLGALITHHVRTAVPA